jgi:hypothetical protein
LGLLKDGWKATSGLLSTMHSSHQEDNVIGSKNHESNKITECDIFIWFVIVSANHINSTNHINSSEAVAMMCDNYTRRRLDVSTMIGKQNNDVDSM